MRFLKVSTLIIFAMTLQVLTAPDVPKSLSHTSKQNILLWLVWLTHDTCSGYASGGGL
jgi:hypothetical protein